MMGDYFAVTELCSEHDQAFAMAFVLYVSAVLVFGSIFVWTCRKKSHLKNTDKAYSKLKEPSVDQLKKESKLVHKDQCSVSINGSEYELLDGNKETY